MTPISAHSPVRSGPDKIDLMVKFDELQEEVPFTASAKDTEAYGVHLYNLAVAGEFGPIAAIVAK